jgi:hypothetical protein
MPPNLNSELELGPGRIDIKKLGKSFLKALYLGPNFRLLGVVSETYLLSNTLINPFTTGATWEKEIEDLWKNLETF